MKRGSVTVNKNVIEGEMYYHEEIVLHYRIEYPQFMNPCYERIRDAKNCFYKARAMKQQMEFEKYMYKEAVNQYNDSVSNEFPFHMYESIVAYEVTYNQDCVVSLYFDRYSYTGGAHGNTVRRSETWAINSGNPLGIYCLLPNKRFPIQMICKQIATQISHGENWYFEDYQELVRKNFNPKSFYLHSAGVVIYYQQYDIAPYSSGMPEFTIPWGTRVRPPMCCK